MSDKNSKDPNSQSDNDEDFGLPPVNVTPLKGAKAAGTKSSEGSKNAASGSKNNPPAEEKKKDNTLGIFLIILLLILGLGFGLYYFGAFNNFDQQSADKTATTTPNQVEKPAPVVEEQTPEPVIEESELPEETSPQLIEINSRADAPRYFLVVGSFIDDDLLGNVFGDWGW